MTKSVWGTQIWEAFALAERTWRVDKLNPCSDINSFYLNIIQVHGEMYYRSPFIYSEPLRDVSHKKENHKFEFLLKYI